MDEGSQQIRLSWNYRLFIEWDNEPDGAKFVLDADDCPVCGTGVINAEIAEQVQFVAASTSFEENLDNDIEHTPFQADDGPHCPELQYAQCASCKTVLYDS